MLGFISNIDWAIRLILTGISGAGAVMSGYFTWANGWPLYYSIPMAIFVLLTIFGFIIALIKRFGIYRIRNIPPQNNISFYQHRPDMETLKKFIREHEVVYTFFPMGDSLYINHFYELDEYKSKLRRVILMDIEGKHLEAIPEKYYVSDSASLRKGINEIVDVINNTDIVLKLWDGCFPYSILIGNPLSKVNSGSILLEVIAPFTPGNDRHGILFKQSDYPELFERMKQTYEVIWEKSREAKLKTI